MQSYAIRSLIVGFAVIGTLSCSDSKGTSAKALVQGLVNSVLSGEPQANREFQVIDLSTTEGNPKLIGVSDENGAFEFEPGSIKELVVLFAAQSSSGEPRSSGLVNVASNAVMKTLDAVTDIACQAGVSAVTDGSIAASDLTPERIANLEAAAAQIVSAVDFNDAESVAAAAQQVRDDTSDGAHPPAS